MHKYIKPRAVKLKAHLELGELAEGVAGKLPRELVVAELERRQGRAERRQRLGDGTGQPRWLVK